MVKFRCLGYTLSNVNICVNCSRIFFATIIRSMIQIIHNNRCTKSRNALTYLEEEGYDYEVIEYLKEPMTVADLTEVIRKLGIAPVDLLRKGEAIYKEAYKGKDLSDAEWITAMVEHPKLIERPIVIKGDKAVVGRPLENVVELLRK